MAVLVFQKTGGIEERYILERDVTIIGRESGCEIHLSDASVSRRHATIARTGSMEHADYSIEDHGSKNGTLVNGVRVSRAVLKDKDFIHFGDVAAIFRSQIENQRPAETLISAETGVLRTAETEAHVKLRLLYDLADAAASIESEEGIAKAGLAILCRQLGCENAYVGFLEGPARRIARSFYFRTDAGSAPFRISHGILNKTVEDAAALLLVDALGHQELQDRESVVGTGTRSVMCVPMLAAGRFDGVLYADTRTRIRPFGEEDLGFMTAFASLLGAILRNFRTVFDLRERNRELTHRIEGDDLVGDHPRMEAVRSVIASFAARGNAPVLLQGESGVGKDLAARMIHRLSGRADKPFLTLNCAAVPHGLIESELFGHVKGAFTGAFAQRRGLFELAHGGALLLDEIGDLPLELQAKLLRVLESGEFRPVGGETTRQSDARLIAATNRDLDAMVKSGAFRRDLFFRLNVLRLEMPPLRTHASDIPTLASIFLSQLRAGMCTDASSFSPAAMERLMRHSWPGNVRELKNVIERALYACNGTVIGPEHLTGLDGEADGLGETITRSGVPAVHLESRIEDVERAQIMGALERNGWNKTKAAAELGIARKTVIAKVKKYDLRTNRS